MQNILQKVVPIIQQITKEPSIILLFILFVLFIVSKCTKITYFDISKIFKGYYSSFNSKFFVIAKMFFMVLLSIIACKYSILDDDTINIITIIISVLTGMFFELITFLPDSKNKFKESKKLSANESKIRLMLIIETYRIIMFEIFLCILILLLCFMAIFSNKYSICNSFIVYFLVFVMISNMFIVLSRIFNIIDEILNLDDKNK